MNVKKPYIYSNLKMSSPYLGHPEEGRWSICQAWMFVPKGGDEYNNISVNHTDISSNGRRCCDINGPFYVSEDFVFLDNGNVICPYCGVSCQTTESGSATSIEAK